MNNEMPQNSEGERFPTVEAYNKALEEFDERKRGLEELRKELDKKYIGEGRASLVREWPKDVEKVYEKKNSELIDEEIAIRKQEPRVLVEEREEEEGEKILEKDKVIKRIEEI